MCQTLGIPWVPPRDTDNFCWPRPQISSLPPPNPFLAHLLPHSEQDPGPQLLCDPGGICQLPCDPGSQMVWDVVAVAKSPFLPLWFVTSPHLFPIKAPLSIPPAWSRPAPEGADPSGKNLLRSRDTAVFVRCLHPNPGILRSQCSTNHSFKGIEAPKEDQVHLELVN